MQAFGVFTKNRNFAEELGVTMWKSRKLYLNYYTDEKWK